MATRVSLAFSTDAYMNLRRRESFPGIPLIAVATVEILSAADYRSISYSPGKDFLTMHRSEWR